MADIELVIKIPEDVYKKTVFYREFRNLNDCVTTIKALENGIVLPKGHGGLIDADELLSTFWTYCRKGDFGYHQAEDLIKSKTPIIEADTAESEDGE